MNKVINFHSISDSSWFESTLGILKSKYTMIGIDQIEEYFYNNKKLTNTCHITFDDGDASFYNIAYPILKKHNIPATIFVSPDIIIEKRNFWFQEIKGYNAEELKKIVSEYLGIESNCLKDFPILTIFKCLKIDQMWDIIEIYQKRNNIQKQKPQNLSLDQLIEIDRQGLVCIGGHTINHPILANENDNKSLTEITDSFTGLKEILGHDIKYFAYPNGYPVVDFGPREMNTLKTNNCRIAFSCNPGNLSKSDHPLSISRLGFSHGNFIFVRVKLILAGYWDSIRDTITHGEIKARIKLKKILVQSGKTVGKTTSSISC